MYDALLNLTNQGYAIHDIAQIVGLSDSDTKNLLETLGIHTTPNVNSNLERFKHWIKDTLNQSIETNCTRQNIAFDIWLPSLNLGFDIVETNQTKKGMLQKKALTAREANVAKSFITPQHLANQTFMTTLATQLESRQTNKQVIGARKLQIREVTPKMANAFLKLFHLQGPCRSKHYYALFSDDKIVSLLSMGQSRFRKNTWEIHRYCPNPYWAVSGGFERLLQTMTKNLCSQGDIVNTYMNLNVRLTTSNIYEKAGFECKGPTAPDYCWITPDGKTSLSRYQTTKKRLTAQGYNPNLTERQIMKMRGFTQSFGAGSLLYSITI